MFLEILPTRTAGAAENMALDFLILQRYPLGRFPRLRHYEWRAPAFTFGYAQKIAFVRPQLPADERIDLCRRPTGGGIVDHRDDWTYSLVIPRGHPLEELRAAESYRTIHAALATTLRAQGVAAGLKLVAEDAADAAGVCFQRAEVFDVVDEVSGAKIAGAAQKRNKHGLLFQGSIARPQIAAPAFDWDRFETEFGQNIARALGVDPQPSPWPEFHEDEVSGLVEQYSSTQWIEYR